MGVGKNKKSGNPSGKVGATPPTLLDGFPGGRGLFDPKIESFGTIYGFSPRGPETDVFKRRLRESPIFGVETAVSLLTTNGKGWGGGLRPPPFPICFWEESTSFDPNNIQFPGRLLKLRWLPGSRPMPSPAKAAAACLCWRRHRWAWPVVSGPPWAAQHPPTTQKQQNQRVFGPLTHAAVLWEGILNVLGVEHR